MRILYITNGISAAGGLERVLSIKASYFADVYNYDVAILTLNEVGKKPFYKFSNRIVFYNIEIRNVRAYFFNYFGGIKKVVKNFKPDIISVCDDGIKGLFIPLWLRGSYKKIIYERHVSKTVVFKEKRDFLNKCYSHLMNIGANLFDAFVVLTNDNVNEWTRVKNIFVISNPLPFRSYELSNLGQKQIISVGRLEYQKGYDLLLTIWKKIELKRCDWQLKIYGEGSLKKELEEQITEMHLQNVHIVSPTNEIIKAYTASSVYVMSSRYEGFGMVLIEAMSCGLPCIAFDCPCGPKNIIHDGENGFLIKMGDIDSYVEKLILLMTDDRLRVTLGQNAARSIDKYTPKSICGQWNDLFCRLLNK